ARAPAPGAGGGAGGPPAAPRERHRRGLEVQLGDFLAGLWCVHDRRVEDHVVGEQFVERLGELALKVTMPLLDDLGNHVHSPVGASNRVKRTSPKASMLASTDPYHRRGRRSAVPANRSKLTGRASGMRRGRP